MPSDKFHQVARRIAREKRSLFDSLLEFERTKKIRTKTRLNFTIDKSLALRFKQLCRRKGYNMSAQIERIMRDLIRKEER